ncbi:MAG: hypothetical protein K8S14_00415 [Actinomycetia bacterium]|nr:hypothetical protein [Actinomycetes bacterium]
MRKKYGMIFLKSLGLFALGVVLGYLFYYFFNSESVYLIEKFKVLQGFFGINQYSEGMSFNRVLLTILLGNLVSVICYTALGYTKLSLPVSFISGSFIVVFLFSGIIRHGTPIPLEVVVLSSIEMLYRIVAISTGEYLSRYRFESRIIPITALSCIFVLYLAAALYEVWQIF